MVASSKKNKLTVKDNLKDSIAAADASERRFRVRATVAVCLLSCVTVYAGKTFGIIDMIKTGGNANRHVFLRGHKDDGGSNGPSTAPLGAACGRENVCATGSYCDGAACVACGGEFQTCCEDDECTGDLECGGGRCLKCWKTDTDDVCGVDSTCCELNTECNNGKCKTVTCGTAGKSCCFDGDDCEGTLECAAKTDTCDTCAAKGETCGVTASCCGQEAGTAVCDDDTNKCVDCGAAGQPVCSGNGPECDEGSYPSDGICEKCGGPGEPCCYNQDYVSDYCPDSNLACEDDNTQKCVECANSGQDCDDSTPCCSEDQTCDRTGKCSACGGEDQPCCYWGESCNSGLICDSDFSVCQPCGGFAEPCCGDKGSFPENYCNEDTLSCDDGRCNTCAAKGKSCKNQECCQDGTTPLICDDSDVCAECGGKDQPCCHDGYDCDTGLFCNDCEWPGTCTDNATAVLLCD